MKANVEKVEVYEVFMRCPMCFFEMLERDAIKYNITRCPEAHNSKLIRVEEKDLTAAAKQELRDESFVTELLARTEGIPVKNEEEEESDEYFYNCDDDCDSDDDWDDGASEDDDYDEEDYKEQNLSQSNDKVQQGCAYFAQQNCWPKS